MAISLHTQPFIYPEELKNRENGQGGTPDVLSGVKPTPVESDSSITNDISDVVRPKEEVRRIWKENIKKLRKNFHEAYRIQKYAEILSKLSVNKTLDCLIHARNWLVQIENWLQSIDFSSKGMNDQQQLINSKTFLSEIIEDEDSEIFRFQAVDGENQCHSIATFKVRDEDVYLEYIGSSPNRLLYPQLNRVRAATRLVVEVARHALIFGKETILLYSLKESAGFYLNLGFKGDPKGGDMTLSKQKFFQLLSKLMF